jgi:hypothetical protein
MSSAFRRVRGEHVAGVEHQPDLDDAERDEQQQRTHEDELDDRSAAVTPIRAPTHQPVIELMA